MKFQLTRARIALLALLAVLAGGALFTWLGYRRLSGSFKAALDGQAVKRLGRQVRVGGVSFSPLEGVIVSDACVSRRPGFSKGEFFCASRAVVKPRLASLLRNQVYFSRITLEKPVLKARESGGQWDFADLLALLPDSEEGLHLTWNADELVLRDARLEADLETAGLSLALEGADLRLGHSRGRGGNYRLKASGTVKSAVKGKLLSSEVELDVKANFEKSGLSSTKGSFEARGTEFGAMTLGSFGAEWDLFNLLKPLPEKNYAVAVEAADFLLPAQESATRDGVARALHLFSAAMGKPAPKIEDIEMSRFAAAFRLDDSKLAVRDIELRTNFLEFDAELTIDGPARTAEARARTAIGPSRLELSASGPLDRPVLKPLLSDTLSSKLKEGLMTAEKSLLKVFPVTGE